MHNSEVNYRISILLASYNGEEYILKAVNSVLDQTYKNIELLVGFNGTTDRSIDMVSEIEDSRLRVFSFKEKGKGKTLNKLLKKSTGEWVAIQDDDDIWNKNKLEKQSRYLEHYDVIGTQILYIDKKENSPTIFGSGPFLATDDKNIKELTKRRMNQIANTSAIVRKKALESTGGWREDVDGVEDMDLWLKLINKNYNFINLQDRLVMHRIHGESNFNSDKCDHNLNKIFNE